MLHKTLTRLVLFVALAFVAVACGSRSTSQATPVIPTPTDRENSKVATEDESSLQTEEVVIPTPVPSVAIPTPVPTDDSDSAETNPDDEVAEADPASRQLVVGSRDFTEQFVLAHITMQLLANAGFEIVDSTGLGGTQTAHAALRTGEIDLYWEYTGTALSEFHNVPPAALPTNGQIAWQSVSALDETHNDLVWLTPSAFNDTYTLMIREGTISADLTTMDDLATFMNENDSPLTVCVENDFFARGDGFFPLQETYGFNFQEDNVLLVSYDNLYTELRAGTCDVAEGFSTDGRISAWGFQNLDDSRFFFPAYNAAPIVRQEILDQYPEIAVLLNEIGPLLTNEVMTELNARVDIGADGERDSGDEETLEQVAQDFLLSNGLIGDRPRLRLATIETSEFEILGSITRLLLENDGFRVDETIYGGSGPARDALTEDNADMMWEMTARGLTQYHNIPPTALPQGRQATYEMVASLDSKHNALTWTTPAAFDAKLTLVSTSATLIEEIGSMSQLAQYLETNRDDVRLCVDEITYSATLPLGERFYGIRFVDENIVISDVADVLTDLRAGLCDLAIGRAIDARIGAWGLLRLPDNTSVFPATNASPLLVTGIGEQFPEIGERLAEVGQALDTEAITIMSARLELGADGIRDSGDEESAETIARDFLEQTGFLGDRPQVVVGSRDFTEQFVLAYLSIVLLEDAGFRVIDRTGLGGTNTGYDALSEGTIEVLWEYTGTALSEFHDVDPLPTDPEEAWRTVSELDAPNDLQWLQPGLFNDTYTLMINPALLDINAELVTIEDLAEYMNANDSPLTLCVENDFFSRGDGLFPLQEHYGFAFQDANIELVSYDSLYDGLREGLCQVAEGFSTDGRIGAWGFQNLEDSQQFFPAYNAAPIVRGDTIAAYPEVVDVLNQLGAFLDNETITRLNAQVDLGPDSERGTGDEESAKTVARLFLCEVELISDCPNIQPTEVVETPADDTSTDEVEPTPVAEIPFGQPGSCGDILTNGSFEDTNGWGLPQTSSSAAYTAVQVHQGDWAAELGAQGRGTVASFSAVNQRVFLPEGVVSAEISFWYYPVSLDLVGGDSLGLYIYDTTLTILQEQFLIGVTNDQAWSQLSFDVSNYSGQEIVFHFVVVNDGDGVPTTMFLDDIALQVCY